jgi:transposase
MTHSEELREAVLALVCKDGYNDENIAAVAATLNVSVSSIKRWWTLMKRTGSVKPNRRRTRSHESVVEPEDLLYAIELLEVEPSLFMKEIAECIFTTHHKWYPAGAIRIALTQAGWTHKVLYYRALERNEELRQHWRDEVQSRLRAVPASYFLFLDESHLSEEDAKRRFGWSPRGKRAWGKSSLRHQSDPCCAIATMSIEGIQSVSIRGIVNSEIFLEVLLNDVLPIMNPYPAPGNNSTGVRSVLVMDNAPTHIRATIVALCENCGVVVLFLPPYSFDLNPIEHVFHSAKQYIRTRWNGSSAENPLEFQLKYALWSCLSAEQACAMVSNDGYFVSETEKSWALRG